MWWYLICVVTTPAVFYEAKATEQAADVPESFADALLQRSLRMATTNPTFPGDAMAGVTVSVK